MGIEARTKGCKRGCNLSKEYGKKHRQSTGKDTKMLLIVAEGKPYLVQMSTDDTTCGHTPEITLQK